MVWMIIWCLGHHSTTMFFLFLPLATLWKYLVFRSPFNSHVSWDLLYQYSSSCLISLRFSLIIQVFLCHWSVEREFVSSKFSRVINSSWSSFLSFLSSPWRLSPHPLNYCFISLNDLSLRVLKCIKEHLICVLKKFLLV